MKKARCFWYDQDGNAYEQAEGGHGCKRFNSFYGKCAFVHPSEPDWASSPSLQPGHPPFHLLSEREKQKIERNRRTRQPSPRHSPRGRPRTPTISPRGASVYRPRRSRTPSPVRRLSQSFNSQSFSRRDYHDRERDEGERSKWVRDKERERENHRERERTPDSIKSTPPSRPTAHPSTSPVASRALEAPSAPNVKRESPPGLTSRQALQGPPPLSSASGSLAGSSRDWLPNQLSRPPKQDSVSSIMTAPDVKELNERTIDPRLRPKDATKVIANREGSRAGSAPNTAMSVPERSQKTNLDAQNIQGKSSIHAGQISASPQTPLNPAVPQANNIPTLVPARTSVPQSLSLETTSLPSMSGSVTPLLSEPLPPSTPSTPFVATPTFAVPAPPSALAIPSSTSQSAESGEMPMVVDQDSVNAWESLLQIFTKYTQVLAECEQLKRDLRMSVSLTKGWAATTIPAETGAAIEKRIQETGKQYREKEKELDKIRGQLAEVIFVPVFGSKDPPSESAVQEAHAGIQLTELKEELEKLSKDVEDLRIRDAPTASSSSQIERSERAVKRLRLGQEAMNVDEDQALRNEVLLTPSKAKNVVRLVEKFQQRLADLENQWVQFDQDRIMEIDTILQDKYEAFKATLTPETPRPAPDPALGYKVEMETWFRTFRENLDATDAQMGELAQAFAQILAAQDGIREENGRLKEENRQLKEEKVQLLRRMTEDDQKHAEDLDNIQKELLAHNAAISAHLSAYKPDTASPITVETVLDSLGPVLTQSVQGQVVPLITELQTKVQEMVDAQKKEMDAVVTSKVTTTMQAVQAIKIWLEKMGVDRGVTAVNNA